MNLRREPAIANTDTSAATPREMEGPTSYWAYGPWSFLRDISTITALTWALYTLYCVNSTYLEATPVNSKQKIEIVFSTIKLILHFFGWTFINWLASLLHSQRHSAPAWLFVMVAVVNFLNNIVAFASLLDACARSPRRMEASDPRYTVERAEAYYLWIAVKVPMLAVLHATCAVFIALDFVMWFRWDFGRKERATRLRDVEMQDRRVMAVCNNGPGVGTEVSATTRVAIQTLGPKKGEEEGH